MKHSRPHFDTLLGIGDTKKLKRIYAKMGTDMHYDILYSAHVKGEMDAMRRKPYRNPYPKGKRHDNYHSGYNNYEHHLAEQYYGRGVWGI